MKSVSQATLVCPRDPTFQDWQQHSPNLTTKRDVPASPQQPPLPSPLEIGESVPAFHQPKQLWFSSGPRLVVLRSCSQRVVQGSLLIVLTKGLCSAGIKPRPPSYRPYTKPIELTLGPATVNRPTF